MDWLPDGRRGHWTSGHIRRRGIAALRTQNGLLLVFRPDMVDGDGNRATIDEFIIWRDDFEAETA
jgi:hypothetical protein